MAVINGTAASETLPGTAAADTITGAGGDDTALMGAGNDVFIWNVDDGSDTVEGGVGKDTLRFNGSNVNELLTMGALAGGDAGVGRNIGGGGVTLDDVERIELQALGNSDTIRIHDLTGTDVKQVAVDLSTGTPGVGDGAIDTITIEASTANNTINLTQASGIISVAGLAAQITLAAAEAADFLEIRGLAGNDKINAAALPAAVLLTLNGGEGNDTITGGAGNDTLMGGDGNDTVTGGGGNDSADLGKGNDLFVWNPGDGDDKIEGGDGIDTLRFVDSAVNQEINITTNGGGRTNLLADVGVVFADLNDVERIELRLLGGEDTVRVNDLVGTEVTAVVVDLAGTSGGVAGDKKFDRVGVEGNNDDNSLKVASAGVQVIVSGLSAQVSVVHADKTDILDVFGGGGNDTIDGSKLAAGKLALQLFGSFGADTLIGSAGNDYALGGDGNDLALLGSGNDFFDWNLGDDNDTVEGQAGTDTVRMNGDAGADVFELAADVSAHGVLFDNVGNARTDLNDVEHVWIRAQDGADSITVSNLSTTDIKQVTLDLGGGGGDLAFDNVTVNGTNGNDKVQVSFPGGVLFTGLPYTVGITGFDVDKDSITFNGLGGNDSIDGSKLPAGIVPVILDGGIGNDTVAAGAGDDVVFGGDDNDKLSGAAGDDDLLGGNGNDVIDGGAGADDLSGGNGDDTVTGGGGNDIGLLGAGNDLFIWNVGDGSDTINGGTDFDTLRLLGSIAGDTIGISANGSQTVLAAPGGATLELNAERIEIRALGGADTIAVGDIATTNVTEIAIDLAATPGGKTADTKIDTVSVLASLDSETSVMTLGSQVFVETAQGEVAIDHWGKGDVLVLNGNSGDELLNANALAAKSIALQVFAGKGADLVLGSAGNDQIAGGDGNDTLSGGAGNDVFIWNPGDDKDIIDGQAGVDTLRVNGDSNSEITSISSVGGHALFSQIVANVVQDLDNVERIEFHAADGLDTITVNDLSGSEVKQVAIDLAAGGVSFGDTVNTNGSAGNDAIKVAVAGSVASITGLSAQVTVAHELSTLRIEIDALGGNDSVNGSTLKLNSIQSLAVDGSAGNDTLTGGLGNDVLSGGDDNDKMLGGGGNDQLFGDNGKDVLDGGTGNDSLTGGAGNDVLTGGVGDDAFTGGQGDDTMTGGTGKDELHYTGILDGHDVFIGFDGNAAGGQDTLDLNLLFDSLGVQTADRAGRVSILDNGASVDVIVDTDGLNGFDLTVATLKTADSITVGQDILVGTL
jgi:Ca2+-binding RTX toxin-like protein